MLTVLQWQSKDLFVPRLIPQTWQEVCGLLEFPTQPLFTTLKVQEVWKSSKLHLGILQFRKNWFMWTLESSKGQAKVVQFCLRDIIGDGHLVVCVILGKIRPIVRKSIKWLFYVLIDRSEVKLPKQEFVFVLSESILIGGPLLPIINRVSC